MSRATGITMIGGFTGNLTVNLAPANSGELSIGGNSTTADFVIPAGAFKVELKNVGAEGNGIDAIATYNGIPLPPDPFTIKVLEVRKDEVNNEEKRLPVITVITNGAEIWYSVES